MTDFEELRTELAKGFHLPKHMMFAEKITDLKGNELDIYYSEIKKQQDKISFYNHMYLDKFANWVKNGAKKYKKTIKIKKRIS